jgi:bifunctional UDP-N-acetylglucosamine pyrophosphorylase / glucosamine-1-phosphate N-acetyltransferase
VIKIKKISVLIPAAGKGSRSGLEYPKSLFLIQGKPILVRIHERILSIDKEPTIVINPIDQILFEAAMLKYNAQFEFLFQETPKGMGDAVLQFKKSEKYDETENILLVWGDIPFLQERTINKLIRCHFSNNNHFTFVTIKAKSPYTIVKRDRAGNVKGVLETREMGVEASEGESDIGLFIFNKDIVFKVLEKDLIGKYGESTKEHGFLYIIEHLYKNDYKIEAIPVATELDAISFNQRSDIENYI